MIDSGEGTQYQLLRYGINPLKINAIFITHLHGDHVYGIFGLLSTMSMMGRTRRLEIIAPHPFSEMLRSHFGFFGVELPYPLDIKEVDTRTSGIDVWSNRVFSVSSLPLRHRVPCCGYLFREHEPSLNVHKHLVEGYGLTPDQITVLKQGRDTTLANGAPLTAREATYRPYTPRSYAFCSDTTPSGKVAALVEGVDLLYHESTSTKTKRSPRRPATPPPFRPPVSPAERTSGICYSATTPPVIRASSPCWTKPGANFPRPF